MIMVIYVFAYVVELYVIRRVMRCKDYFVADGLIDAYVTPFMYTCSDQTMYARTRVGDVCVMWSNLVVCI